MASSPDGKAAPTGGITIRGGEAVQLAIGGSHKVVLGIDLHLEFEDACGTPLDGFYVLEHPDGRLEQGRLEDGVLHRDDVPAGEYQVHFPEILEVRWSVASVQHPSGGGPPPPIWLIVRHVGFAAESKATFTFYRETEAEEAEEAEAEVLHEIRRKLSSDDARILEEQETRVPWRHLRVDELEPGESCEVTCRVEIDGLTMSSAPLLELGPPIADADGPAGESLHIELEDAFGTALDGPYVLEHPDGKLEEGRLVGGVLHRDDVSAGDYQVHLGELLEARWSVDTIEQGGGASEVELILRHTALGGAHEATFTFVREQDAEDAQEADEDVLHELRRHVNADAARLLEPQETRVPWRFEGLDALEAGESCDVVCRVEVAGLALHSAPLQVLGPPIADADGPTGESLHIEIEDAFGTALDGPYVLEHPDGRLEEGRLAAGVLHRDDVPAGDYQVHLGELLEARWSVDTIEHGGGASEVELILRHAALGAAHEATFTFVREQEAEDAQEADEDVLHELSRNVAADAARLLEPQETRVPGRFEGLDALEAGESCDVVCRVEVAGLTLQSAPLQVLGPEIDETS